MKEKEKYVIFHIDGGIGKNIMATAVVRAIQKTFPDFKIIVVASHEDFWINNPRVHRVYKQGTLQYFYRDYIRDNEVVVLLHDPYRDHEYMMQDTHLVEVWCNMFGLQMDGVNPEIYYTPREIQEIEMNFPIKENYVMIQPHGGANPNMQYSWTRDIPLENTVETINYFNSQGYKVYQIKNDKQPLAPGAIELNMPIRTVAYLLTHAKHRILIDSFAQHVAAALNLPSTVIWIANSPTVFGYSMHKNIKCSLPYKFDSDKYSYLLRFDATAGNVFEFPYDRTKLFDTEDILGLPKEKKAETTKSVTKPIK